MHRRQYKMYCMRCGEALPFRKYINPTRSNFEIRQECKKCGCIFGCWFMPVLPDGPITVNVVEEILTPKSFIDVELYYQGMIFKPYCPFCGNEKGRKNNLLRLDKQYRHPDLVHFKIRHFNPPMYCPNPACKRKFIVRFSQIPLHILKPDKAWLDEMYGK